MNEHLLLDLATDLGYELAISGAETYRVEDSARLVLTAYGLSPEVAATNNYLIVSILSADRTPITRMRRIGFHGNNLDAVERLNALSRRLCAETPAPEIAAKMLEETRASVPYYSFPVVILGHLLGAGGFGLLFGCRPTDALLAGLGGILIAFVNRFASAMKTNPIFSTLAASFLMSLLAYGLGAAGIAANADTVIIGGMMILVPGLVFTNALRDMIYGDISSGIHKCVQVLLIAGSMALGSAAARNLTIQFWGPPGIPGTAAHSLGLLCFGAFLGCTGFSILFNIHGPGMLLCTLGGIAAYAVYALTLSAGFAPGTAFFVGTAFSALYSEIMARVRKYPAICYLVVSIIPLIPGASLYYTMQQAVADGTVTPLLYEERVPDLSVNEEAIDAWFDRITSGLTDQQRADLKRKFSRSSQIDRTKGRMELIAADIAAHLLTLPKGMKGQLACSSKGAAVAYQQIFEDQGLISSAVVISPPDTREGHEEVDAESRDAVAAWWSKHVGKEAESKYTQRVLDRFATEGDPQLLIVVSKLLTGFDEPRNMVLYIDKPLKQHELLQAIARVNRLHELRMKRCGSRISSRAEKLSL